MNPIKADSTVTLHYKIAVDGGVFDSSFGEEPLEFVMGEGLLEPVMEQVLIGLKKGDKQTFEFKSGQAFGQPDSENIVQMPMSDFGNKLTFAEGHVLEFEMPDGDLVPGTVIEISDEVVVVDFNHPLAGQAIIFKVEILSVT